MNHRLANRAAHLERPHAIGREHSGCEARPDIGKPVEMRILALIATALESKDRAGAKPIPIDGVDAQSTRPEEEDPTVGDRGKRDWSCVITFRARVIGNPRS